MVAVEGGGSGDFGRSACDKSAHAGGSCAHRRGRVVGVADWGVLGGDDRGDARQSTAEKVYASRCRDVVSGRGGGDICTAGTDLIVAFEITFVVGGDREFDADVECYWWDGVGLGVGRAFASDGKIAGRISHGGDECRHFWNRVVGDDGGAGVAAAKFADCGGVGERGHADCAGGDRELAGFECRGDWLFGVGDVGGVSCRPRYAFAGNVSGRLCTTEWWRCCC